MYLATTSMRILFLRGLRSHRYCAGSMYDSNRLLDRYVGRHTYVGEQGSLMLGMLGQVQRSVLVI
jgi:hypothetical protein